MMKTSGIRVSMLCSVIAFAGAVFVPAVASAGPVIVPFPFFTPIAECGKVGLVGSWLPDVDECKVWISKSGAAYLVNGIDAFDVGDEVFVDGLICNTCLTTCFAGAILNATVTAGCESASNAPEPKLSRLQNDRELFELTQGEDFMLTDVQFGIDDDTVVITEAGLDFERPVRYETDALEVAAESVVIDGVQLSSEREVMASTAQYEANDKNLSAASFSSKAMLEEAEADGDSPESVPLRRGGFTFDCSTCLDSFCGGTMYCQLVDCDVFCNYACTWVICDPDLIEPPFGQ